MVEPHFRANEHPVKYCIADVAVPDAGQEIQRSRVVRRDQPEINGRRGLELNFKQLLHHVVIEWIEFKNFKALRNAKLPLSRFTLIVGANGSGKSTALQAVLALRGPGQLNFDQVRTAGVPETEAVLITAKWGEFKNEFLIKMEWNKPQYPGGYGPSFQYIGRKNARDGNKPRTALNALDRSRVFSLDANAIGSPVNLEPKMELERIGANLAGLKHRGWPSVRTEDQLFTSRAPADLGRYLSNRARNSFASALNASAPVAEAS
jgi:hypothetical protein